MEKYTSDFTSVKNAVFTATETIKGTAAVDAEFCNPEAQEVFLKASKTLVFGINKLLTPFEMDLRQELKRRSEANTELVAMENTRLQNQSKRLKTTLSVACKDKMHMADFVMTTLRKDHPDETEEQLQERKTRILQTGSSKTPVKKPTAVNSNKSTPPLNKSANAKPSLSSNADKSNQDSPKSTANTSNDAVGDAATSNDADADNSLNNTKAENEKSTAENEKKTTEKIQPPKIPGVDYGSSDEEND